jgi:hypothetical protein
LSFFSKIFAAVAEKKHDVYFVGCPCHMAHRKNKTDFRASLKTDCSLSAILMVKLNNPNPSHTNQALSLKS